MGLINWNAGAPSGPTPGQEVASVTGLLSALAERRAKQQQEEAMQAFREREFQNTMANQRIDNDRADKTARDNASYMTANLEQTKLAHRDTQAIQQRDRVERALTAARAARSPEEARQILQSADFQPDGGPSPAPQQHAPPPPDAISGAGAPAPRQAIEPPPMPVSTGVFPGAAPPTAPSRNPAPEPVSTTPQERASMLSQMAPPSEVLPGTSQAPAPAPGSSNRWRTPAGSVIDFDPVAIQASRAADAKRQAEGFAASMAGHTKGKFAQRAIDETVGAMQSPTWDPKEDPHAMFSKRQEDLEHTDASDRHAAASRAEAAAGRAAAAGRGDANRNIRGLNTLRADLRENDSRWNLRPQLKDFEEIKKGLNLIGTPAGTAQATALDNLIKVGRGGVVTKQSMEFISNHMGGSLDRLRTAVRATINGQFSDPSIADAKRTLQELHDTILAEVHDKSNEFKDTYLADPQYEPVRGNLESEHDKRFGPFGLTVKRSGAKSIDYTGQNIAGQPQASATEDPRLKTMRDNQAEIAKLAEQLKALGAK